MMNFIYILTAIALIFMNAFFVAAEFGMVKLRRTRVISLKDHAGLRGKILGYVHQHLDVYLSACQLGITLASLGLGWVGEPAFAQLLEPTLRYFGINAPDLIHIISFFAAFSLISFLHIVVGELMPKSLAIRQSEFISLWTAIPLYIFYWIMYPAIWILNGCSNFLLNIAGLNKTSKGESFYSTDEIKFILNTSHLHGELRKDETTILEQTLLFADLKVTEVLRPVYDMIALDIRKPITENLKIMADYHYSRYPVYDKNIQNIIGILHIKDVFSLIQQGQAIDNLQPLLRPAVKISQNLPALDLLRQFREGLPHFALVYKNPKTLLGFVTLDNLLHVLIGRIKDEFHRTQDDWVVNPDGSLVVSGDCPIASLERALDTDINTTHIKPRPETLTAFIVAQLGRFPEEQEAIKFKEFTAIVEKLRGSRIYVIKIVPTTTIDEE